MIESLWLSMGIPKVVAVVVFPAVMVAVRGLLWAWNQSKRQPSRVDDRKLCSSYFRMSAPRQRASSSVFTGGLGYMNSILKPDPPRHIRCW